MTYNPDLIDVTPPADSLLQAVTRLNSDLSALAEILNAYPEAAALVAFVASKGQPSGLASLDAGGLLPVTQLPPLSITDVFVVADEAAMLALDAERGDAAVFADLSHAYLLKGDDPSDIDDWQALPSPSTGVISVEGRTGVVSLSDLYLAAAQKAAANGLASLNGDSKVAQDPANATATPTAAKIPIAGAGGKLDSWISEAGAENKGLIQLAGQLGGTAASPTVVGLTESGGQALDIGAIADGMILGRVGTWAIGIYIPDVMDCSLRYVSSATVKLAFGKSCYNMLFNGSIWVPVPLAAEPTVTTSDNDMGGTALTHAVVYDVFELWNDGTSSLLKLAPWAVSTAGSSARCAAWLTATEYKIGARRTNGSPAHYYACIHAHTSGDSTQPGVGTSWADEWVDNGTDPGVDYRGLYLFQGRRVFSGLATGANAFDGRKYRWLGSVLLFDDSGTKFRDTVNLVSVANFYNRSLKYLESSQNKEGDWTFTGTGWQELNGGTTNLRAKWVDCITTKKSTTIGVQIKIADSAATAYMRRNVDGVTGAWIANQNTTYVSVSKDESLQCGPGHHEAYLEESSQSATIAMTALGYANCRLSIYDM